MSDPDFNNPAAEANAPGPQHPGAHTRSAPRHSTSFSRPLLHRLVNLLALQPGKAAAWLILASLPTHTLAAPNPSPIADLTIAPANCRCYTTTTRFNDLRPAPDSTRLFAATDGGLLEFSPAGALLRKSTLTDGLPAHSIREIAFQPPHILWLATGAGLVRLQTQTGTCRTFTTRDGLNDNRVHAVACDPAGTLYAGTERGISRFDGARFVPFDDTHEFCRRPTYHIHVADDGSIWFAKANALTHYLGNGQWQTFQRDPLFDDNRTKLISNSLLCVSTDPAGRPWVGTKLGLGHFTAGAWEHLFHAERLFHGTGLLDNRIVSIARDTNGWLWLAHGDSHDYDTPLGITAFRTNEWRYFSTTNGLPSDLVYRVRATGSNSIWLATGLGGCRLDNGILAASYPHASELPANQVTAIRQLPDGQIALQTARGIALFAAGNPVSPASYTNTGNIHPTSLTSAPAQVLSESTSLPGSTTVQVRVRLTGSNGEVWIGTRDHGLFRQQGNTWSQVRMHGNPMPREIIALCEEQPDILWLGTAADGAIRLDLRPGPADSIDSKKP